MNVSDYTINFLGEAIAGDLEGFPYRSGPELVKFFNQYGSRDVYPTGGGFPTRRVFAQDKVRELNGTPALDDAVCAVVDPRVFQRVNLSVEEAVETLNANLKYDGYELAKEGHFYKIRSLASGRVAINPAVTSSDALTQAAIDEHIRKCESKLSDEDYSGAITNARSLLEAVLTAIEQELDPAGVYADKDLPKQYRRVQRLLNLGPERKDVADSLRQVLQGLAGVVNGLSAMRNKMSDAHGATYRAEKHHAQLAVYAATTLANFLFDSKNYQQKRGLVGSDGGEGVREPPSELTQRDE